MRFGQGELKRQKQTTQPFVGQLTGEQKTQKKMEFDRVFALICFYSAVIWEGTRNCFFLCVDCGSMSLSFLENVLHLEKWASFGNKYYLQQT